MRIWLTCLAIVVAAALGTLPLRASDDPLAGMDAALLASARAGDPQAAMDLANALIAQWEEPRLRAALPFFEDAQTGFLRRDGPGTDAGIAALMVGRVMNGLSEYQGALRQADAAGAIFAQLPRDAWVARLSGIALEDRASALQNLSRYPEALAAAAAAREVYSAMDPPDEGGIASTWWNEGMSRESTGAFAEALSAYAHAIEYHARTEGEDSLSVGYLSTNIGWVYTRMKDYPRARAWQERALAIIEPAHGTYHENTTKLRINIGLVALEEGNADEAIGWAMKALPFIAANRRQMLSDQRWNFELLSRAFAMKGQVERAIFFGKMAVNAQQEIRATNTIAGAQDMAASQAEWRRLYQSLADLLIAQGRISEAQAVLNMEKEEEVFEFLRRDAGDGLAQTRAILTDAELDEEARLEALSTVPVAAERELRAIMAKIDAGTATEAEEDQAFVLQEALQAAADRFDADVEAFLAELPDAERPAMQVQFDAVGSYQAVLETLDRPTAILQVAALDEATHLFLTLPGLTLHRQVPVARADLARQVLEALQAIESVSPDVDAQLQALYQVVFAPVAPDLTAAGIEVVMLNLDGFLRYVPFAALHDGTGYLIERHALAIYTPAVPTQFAAAPRSPDSTAGFGVTAAHPGFSPLPGVRAELAAIFGEVLAGETVLDAGFDERALRRSLLRKPAILHIASHFNLMPGREDDSFLLLGDGSHLPLSRIRSTRALRFQGVDLLTLSACQTARGGDGSEIDGFAATAQLNGAGAVMASLWPVSDAATPALMRDFYAGLMEGGLDKAEALRQAQIAMLRGGGAGEGTTRAAEALDAPEAPQGFAHPYFWSAFVLMGNWL
ncbi:MAG: CHAT domain-containing protein [Paracoccaceae bacterium]|nr:MAG: CHAT domain-containing protein [Paracoccaceae bacterium]